MIIVLRYIHSLAGKVFSEFGVDVTQNETIEALFTKYDGRVNMVNFFISNVHISICISIYIHMYILYINTYPYI